MDRPFPTFARHVTVAEPPPGGGGPGAEGAARHHFQPDPRFGRHLLRDTLLLRGFHRHAERALPDHAGLPAHGAEAATVGLMQALRPEDTVVVDGVGADEALALGVPVGRVLEALCARGGVWEIRSGEPRVLGRPPGDRDLALALALGAAFAAQHAGRDGVTACLFDRRAGDPAALVRCMALAAAWRLPLLLIERRRPALQAEAAPAVELAGTMHLDGIDVVSLAIAARSAVAAVRGGAGPRLLAVTVAGGEWPAEDTGLHDPVADLLAWLQPDGPFAVGDDLALAATLEAVVERQLAAAFRARGESTRALAPISRPPSACMHGG